VVVVRDGTTPPVLGPEQGEGTSAGEASPFLAPDLARLARAERATHLMTGVLADDAAPAGRREGRARLRLTLATADGKERRGGEVSARVSRRAKTAAVASALALAAGELVRHDFAPLLDVASSAEPQGAAALVARGLEALEAGDLDEARRRLDRAAAEAPRDPRVNAALGDFLLRMGRPAGAVSRYRQSLLFDPADLTVRQRLLRALDRHGDRAELARASREAIGSGAADAQTWYFLAIGCLAQGLAAEAAQALRESLAREPAAGEAQRARAFLLAATGRPEEAMRILEPAAGEGYRDRAALLDRVRALQTDPIADLRELLHSPETLADAEGIRQAAGVLVSRARALLGATEDPGEIGQRRTLAAAARAHAITAWWARAASAEMAQNLHSRVEGALAAVARAALAAAVAADRPWPGGAGLVARLRGEAAAALQAAEATGEGAANGTSIDPRGAAPGDRRACGSRGRADPGRRGARAAGRRGGTPRQLHVLLPDRDQHRREPRAHRDILANRAARPAVSRYSTTAAGGRPGKVP
jgi:Tfp pilus assembly protein PilF